VAEPIDSLRVMLNDPITDYTDTAYGDGVKTTFYTSHKPLYATPSVSVDGSAASPTVTLSSGKLVFLAAPGDGLLVVAEYQATVFTDAQIQSFFDVSGLGANLDLAAAAGWRARAARYVEEVNFTADGVEVQNSTKYRAALQQALAYEQKGNSASALFYYSSGIPTAGGIDTDEKRYQEEDTYRVKPAFARDMMRPEFDTVTAAQRITSEDVR